MFINLNMSIYKTEMYQTNDPAEYVQTPSPFSEKDDAAFVDSILDLDRLIDRLFKKKNLVERFNINDGNWDLKIQSKIENEPVLVVVYNFKTDDIIDYTTGKLNSPAQFINGDVYYSSIFPLHYNKGITVEIYSEVKVVFQIQEVR